MKHQPGGLKVICFLLWLQSLSLIGLEIIFWENKPPGGTGEWAILINLGLLGIQGGMAVSAILIGISAWGIWFMQPWGVILLTITGTMFFVPQAILEFLTFDYSLIQNFEDAFILLGPTCMPQFFAAAIVYSLWRNIVLRR